MSDDTQTQAPAPKDEFFSMIQIPFNEDWQENGFDFVNSVTVAEIFIRATSYAAGLAEQAESLTERVARLEFQLKKRERDLLKIRRTIFSEKFSDITKSAGPEIQNAFLLAKADEGMRTKLLAAEAEVEKYEDEIAKVKPHLDRVKNRMKLLERNMEWAKQFLDFDKLMKRITDSGRPF